MASIVCLLKASPKGQLKYESDPNIEKVILKFKHKPKIQLVGPLAQIVKWFIKFPEWFFCHLSLVDPYNYKILGFNLIYVSVPLLKQFIYN